MSSRVAANIRLDDQDAATLDAIAAWLHTQGQVASRADALRALLDKQRRHGVMPSVPAASEVPRRKMAAFWRTGARRGDPGPWTQGRRRRRRTDPPVPEPAPRPPESTPRASASPVEARNPPRSESLPVEDPLPRVPEPVPVVSVDLPSVDARMEKAPVPSTPVQAPVRRRFAHPEPQAPIHLAAIWKQSQFDAQATEREFSERVLAEAGLAGKSIPRTRARVLNALGRRFQRRQIAELLPAAATAVGENHRYWFEASATDPSAPRGPVELRARLVEQWSVRQDGQGLDRAYLAAKTWSPYRQTGRFGLRTFIEAGFEAESSAKLRRPYVLGRLRSRFDDQEILDILTAAVGPETDRGWYERQQQLQDEKSWLEAQARDRILLLPTDELSIGPLRHRVGGIVDPLTDEQLARVLAELGLDDLENRRANVRALLALVEHWREQDRQVPSGSMPWVSRTVRWYEDTLRRAIDRQVPRLLRQAEALPPRVFEALVRHVGNGALPPLREEALAMLRRIVGTSSRRGE